MATIKDVAQRAGVCIATVSRIMNNRGSVSEKTKKKVIRAMKELDYHPNEMARSLQTRRTHIIGLILPYLDHPFFSRLAESVENACYRMGYKLMVCTSGNMGDKERDMVSMLRSNKVDGILVSSRIPDAGVYSGLDLPIVSIERIIENVPSLSCDNYKGGMLAAQALIEGGSKHPAVIGNQAAEYMPANLRYQGFRDECAKYDITPVEYLLELDNLFGVDFEHTMSEFVKEHPEVDGLFATGDILAVRAINACISLNLFTFDDIRVVGFDGLDISEYLGITTVAQPIRQMGEFAVDLLVKRINGRMIPDRSILPVRLIQRRTTRTDREPPASREEPEADSESETETVTV